MLIVDRYIARSFLSAYFILLTLGIGAYVLFDLLGNMDEFTKNAEQTLPQVLSIMADYYGYNIPLFFSQLSGPIMGFAAAFTLALMLRNNELVALLAAGVPLPRLAAPILVVSVVIVAAWFVNREMLIPSIAEKIARTKDDVAGGRVTGIQYARDDQNVVMSARAFLPREGTLKNVLFLPPVSTGAATLVRADQATWDASRRVWVLVRGMRSSQTSSEIVQQAGARPREEPLDEFAFNLTPEQLILRRDAQWADLLSLKELNALLASSNLNNRTTIEMSRHLRVTQPLTQWILMVLALPFFLARAPTNVLSAGGKALLLSGVFFLASFVAGSLVRDARDPALFIWMPIFLFGTIAVFRLANVKT